MGWSFTANGLEISPKVGLDASGRELALAVYRVILFFITRGIL